MAKNLASGSGAPLEKIGPYAYENTNGIFRWHGAIASPLSQP